ncbi:hypothetical protein COCMIDRAFT_107457, partial [Bipolaris oryzae ATCC 44560]
VKSCLCSSLQRFCFTLTFSRQTALDRLNRSFCHDMIHSAAIIAGILTAVFTVLTSGFGTIVYINRRRHQIRNKSNFCAKTNAPSSPKSSRSQMFSSSACTTDFTKRTQDYHSRCSSLENGPGPTFVKKGWTSMQSNFHSIMDTSNLPSVHGPIIAPSDTCNNLTVPSARATVGADEGTPVPNMIIEPMATGAITLTAARAMKIKRGQEDASISRLSSFHLAVLDIGWGDIQIGGNEEATKSNKPSVSTVLDVSKRPGSYTGVWP